MNKSLATACVVTVTIMLLILPTAQASDIELSETCSLADAITAANTDGAVGGCPAGDGADIINLSSDITLTVALSHITSEITVEGNDRTISGNNRFRIFAVNGGMLIVNNLTMKHGKADWGGAIVNVNGGTLIINNSTVADSQAPEGGAIGNDGILTITSTNLIDNSADYGGAIHNSGGTVNISGGSADGNSTHERGGAVHSKGGMLQIIDMTLNGNFASAGGAIYAHKASLQLIGGTITANRTDGIAGAIWIQDGALEIVSSILEGNSSGSHGGTIYCDFCTLDILQSRISNNVSMSGGGGVSGFGAITIINSIVANNVAKRRTQGSEGGGLNLDGSVNIIGSTIANNSADRGGGLYIGETLMISNSVISGNSATDEGGGIYVERFPWVKSFSATLSHVTLYKNKAKQGGGITWESGSEIIINNSIIAGNNGGDCFGRLAENIGNLIADGSCFAPLNGDPMLGDLVEPENGSLAYFPLLEDSPAIDAADDEYCPDTDIIGTPRPQGAACDIGAYELPQ